MSLVSSPGAPGPVEPAPDADPPLESVEADPPLDGADAEPEPRRYPSTIGGGFYLAILVTMVVAIVVAAFGEWRVGLRILAGALALAAALRLVLPERDAGMLKVRHRLLDVALLGVVAGLLWWLTGSIPDQPPQ